MTIDTLKPFLTTLDGLVSESETDKATYIHPALRNLGAVSIVLVREIVAPTVFKNSEQEITDIEVPTSDGGIQAVRAVPNKFKHRERARGLQILRHFDVGGRFPQNKTNVRKDAPLSDVFDINSFVFGESAYRSGALLPVKAAFLYSDGISAREYVQAVGRSFHNRASEDGTLFDPAKKQNSTAIFDRHYILPGTLLIQSISTIGRMATPELLDHLLLSIGSGGVYGGQTSISGVNVRTHVAGIFANKVERAESSPYLLAEPFLVAGGSTRLQEVMEGIDAVMSPLHAVSIGAKEAGEYVTDLCGRLEADEKTLAKQYREAAAAVANLFTEWFEGKAA